MGFFKNLFGSDNNSSEQNEPINITDVYGLIEYSRGEIFKKLESKSYSETYQKFGLRGVQLHQQLKVHFKLMDILYDYFNTRSPKDVIVKRDWKSDDTNRYGYSQLEEVLNNNKLLKTHDVTLNFESIIKKNKVVYDSLIELVCNGQESRNEIYKGLEWGSSSYDLLDDFISYIIGIDGQRFIDELKFQVIGWNSVCFLTPLSVIHTKYDLGTHQTVIEGKVYTRLPSSFSLNFRHRDRNITKEDLDSVTRWGEIYRHNSVEFLIEENRSIRELIDSDFNLYSQIQEIKKNSFDVHQENKEDDNFVNDIQMVVRHLNNIIEEIETIYEKVLGDKKNHYSYLGYLGPSHLVSNTFEHIEHKLFEFTVIKNLSEILLECVKSNDKFLYREVYLILEPYHIFDRTIEKKTLQELEDLNTGITELNKNLVSLNKTLSRGFKVMNQQLSGINNKLWYNNLLTTINTYQLYKISKK